MPLVQDHSNLTPITEVSNRDEKVTENDYVVQSDGHTTSSKGMTHVPRVANEDYALFGGTSALFDRGKEGVGHPSESILVQSILNWAVERGRKLGDDIL